MDISFLIRLIDQFSGPATKIRSGLKGIGDAAGIVKGEVASAFKQGFSVDNIETATKNAEAALSRARGRLLGAFGTALAIGAPVVKAAQFDQSMKGLEKVLNDLPVERVRQLRKFALDTSALIPIAAKDILELMSEAAQGGVPKEDLEAFSTYVAKAAVAFDMAGRAIGERFAKLRNGYKLNQDGIEDLGDATNHLSNNMAAKAEEITNFTNRAASAAGILKLSAVQAAAFGTSMIAAGAVPETAARGFTAFATRILTGGKRIDAAFKDIGVSREKLLKDIQSEGAGAILEFFELLASKGDEGKAALKDIVGQDYVKDFAKLIDNPQLLAQALKLVAEQSNYAGSATEEASKQSEGAVKRWDLLVGKLNRGAIIIGDALLPTLLALADQVGGLVDRFAEFAEANPELVKYLVLAVATMMGLSIAGKLLAFVFAGMRAGILPLLGLFLKFNKEGRNIARGWRLLSGAARGIGSASRIARAGLRGFAQGAAEAFHAADRAHGRIPLLGRALRRLTAASWAISFGFEILDDLGRTPEERLKQVQENWKRWQEFEQNVEASGFGRWWQSVKDKANELMGLEQGVVPAEVLAAWGRAKAQEFYQVGASWILSLWDGMKSLWESVSQWFSEKIASLNSLLNFDLKINWPEPPAWMKWLLGDSSQATDKVNAWATSYTGALSGQTGSGSGSGDQGAAWLEPIRNLFTGGGDPLTQKVEQTIAAEVIDKRPPTVTQNISAPIYITGVVDPVAAGRAAAAQLGASIANAKSGALHGGTE